MNTARFARTTVPILLVFSLIACGAAPPATQSVDTSKIPITTCSEKARDAFLKGRWLAENLRITDAREYYLKAVEMDPDFASAHLGVATTAPTNQDFFDAYRRAVETSPSASEAVLSHRVEQPMLGKREVAVVRDDDMVVNAEPEKLRTLYESLGQQQILGTWFWTPGRVQMNDDETVRV